MNLSGSQPIVDRTHMTLDQMTLILAAHPVCNVHDVQQSAGWTQPGQCETTVLSTTPHTTLLSAKPG